jgi:hypothetical protein
MLATPRSGCGEKVVDPKSPGLVSRGSSSGPVSFRGAGRPADSCLDHGSPVALHLARPFERDRPIRVEPPAHGFCGARRTVVPEQHARHGLVVAGGVPAQRRLNDAGRGDERFGEDDEFGRRVHSQNLCEGFRPRQDPLKNSKMARKLSQEMLASMTLIGVGNALFDGVVGRRIAQTARSSCRGAGRALAQTADRCRDRTRYDRQGAGLGPPHRYVDKIRVGFAVDPRRRDGTQYARPYLPRIVSESLR